MRGTLRAVILLLAPATGLSCSSQPAPPPDPTPAAATPTPGLSVERLDVGSGADRVVIRVLGPKAGAERARAALSEAKAELSRVAALDAGPELEAAARSAQAVSRGRGQGSTPTGDELRHAYAVDRACDRLLGAGMTDFFVDGGDVVRAQGSQDATLGRGWHVTVFRADGEPLGTVRLREQALAQQAGASPAATAVGGSAVVALGARAGLSAGAEVEGPVRGLALRVGLADGRERQNPAFQGLLNPIGAAY